jgi:membrane protein DedA with SNARE-associated domain
VVFFGRFVAILRTYAAFLAGTSQMRWRLFLPANFAGGVTWAGIYTLASYLAGSALERVSSTIAWVLGGVTVVAIIAGLAVLRRQYARLAIRAERAYPGRQELASGTGACLVRQPTGMLDACGMPGRKTLIR